MGRRSPMSAAATGRRWSSSAGSLTGQRTCHWPRCWPGTSLCTSTNRAVGLGDGQPPTGRLAQITCPTLVLTGTELDPRMSRLPPGVFQRAAASIAEAVPAARLQALVGQNHMVEAKVLAPVLDSFFRP